MNGMTLLYIKGELAAYRPQSTDMIPRGTLNLTSLNPYSILTHFAITDLARLEGPIVLKHHPASDIRSLSFCGQVQPQGKSTL